MTLFEKSGFSPSDGKDVIQLNRPSEYRSFHKSGDSPKKITSHNVYSSREVGNPEVSGSHRIVYSAMLMSLGTLVSRILGLIRDMVIGSFFSRTETDAFFVAFRIPNFFRRFLGEGALSISFIPVFIHCLSGQSKSSGEARARNFMNSVYTIVLTLVSVLTALGILFIGPALQFLFADTPFSQVEGKMSMVITMGRFLFVYLFLVTVYAYFMGIANALGKFFIPALAPAFLNVFMIVFSFFPFQWVSIPPLLLCWGVLTGGAVQVILTTLLLIRLNFLPKLTVSFSIQDLKMMASRFFPGIFGVGGLALVGLLNLYFSGLLEEGTHTFIYYGDRLLEMPRSLIAVSLGTALLPSLSELVARGEKQNMLEKAAHHRDMLLFLVLPCSVMFFCLGLPIVETLFQRGLFDSVTVQKTSLVIQIYSVLLVSASICHVLSTGFYSVQNTWYPAISVVLYVLFHWLFAPYLIHNFGLKGLIWATVTSNIFLMCLLALAYPFYVGKLYLMRTLSRFLWIVPLLVILFFYLKWAFEFFTRFFNLFLNESLTSWLTLFLVLITAFIAYVYMAVKLRVPVAMDFLYSLKQKMSS